MKPHIKKLWLEALRSGEYKQTKFQLHRRYPAEDAGFCCLGVLAEVLLDNEIVSGNRSSSNEDSNEVYVFDLAPLDPVGGTLPPAVCREIELPLDRQRQYTGLNDAGDMTFDQLADLIEEQE